MREAYSKLSVKRKNWIQIIGYSLASVILASAATVAVMYFALERKTLKIAVGPPLGIHEKFATKLAEIVRNQSRDMLLSIVSFPGDAEALNALNRGAVDLAIARTDQHIPSTARSIAELETDLIFVVAPKSQSLSTLANLRGRRVAVIGADAQDEALAKRILDGFDLAGNYTTQLVSQDTPFDKLFGRSGYRAAIDIAAVSKLEGMSRRSANAKSATNVDISGVDGSKGIERKLPGVFSDTIDAGEISSSPLWPSDDTDSLTAKHLLLARSKLASKYGTELVSIVLENKEDLALPGEFATKIDPPDTDKTAFVLAHPGAVDYVGDDVKTFLDRYSDWFYIGTSIAGGFATAAVMLYSMLTKVHPTPASQMLGELTEISDRVRGATTHQELDVAHGELEELLVQTLNGLYNKSMSSDGLDAFRLAYDATHRAIDKKHHQIAGDSPVPAATERPAPAGPTLVEPSTPIAVDFAAQASRN